RLPTYHRIMHTVRSLLNGQPDPVAPGGVRTIANPARLDEVVSEAHLGDAETFLQACRGAKAAQPAWSSVPAPVRGRAIQQLGRLVEDDAEALAQLILHAGIPEGTFQMVLADGPETFAGLERALDEGVVDKVGFTGSTAVGERLGELCGRHLQTPCLELGGKNPLIVMPDADLDLAVEGAPFSGFGTAGQRCTSLGTAIVHRDVHGDL